LGSHTKKLSLSDPSVVETVTSMFMEAPDLALDTVNQRIFCTMHGFDASVVTITVLLARQWLVL
jgi:hypothetical protein